MVSELRVDVSPFLKTYQVDPQFGFLPGTPPLTHLGAGFEHWEDLMLEVPARLADKEVRSWLAVQPALPVHLLSGAQCERAFLMLGILGHSYVHGEEAPLQRLPASLALPWVALAERLGRPPVLAHGSVVLQNWRKKDPAKGMEAENLATLLSFGPTPDEEWFFMLTAAMEAKGAAALFELAVMLRAAKEDQPEVVAMSLQTLAGMIDGLRLEILRMQQGCDPVVFFHQIRPYLSSFQQLHYEGIEENAVRSYAGGSAAQSTLVQALDAGLGIPHEESRSSGFLREMRRYMPPAHRSFLNSLERLAPSLVALCDQDKDLSALRAECSRQLQHFRNAHLLLVSQYILAHSPSSGPGHTGTGGTNPVEFLKQLRNDNARLAKEEGQA